MSAQNIQEFSLLEINTPKLMTGKISNLRTSTQLGGQKHVMLTQHEERVGVGREETAFSSSA